MSTTEIYRKHFGSDCWGAGIFHPKMESFFEELNNECKREDLIKSILATDRAALALMETEE